MFHPHDRIGPYTLIRELGQGSFGEVWLAEKRSRIATTKFALKLPLTGRVDEKAVEQEALVWAQASGHANVLPIIEADIYDNQVVIVSEYAPEGSMESWLKQYGGRAPSVDAAIKMMDGILAGLEHLHAKSTLRAIAFAGNALLIFISQAYCLITFQKRETGKSSL